MSGNTLNFATLAVASPATPPVGWVQATGSNNASIVQLDTKQWQGGPQAVWYDSAEMQGDVIRSVVKLGTSIGANSCGPAIVTTAGNGYMVLCNNASTRLYKCVGSQLGSQIGGNIGTILAASSVIALELRLSDGRIRIFNITSGSDVQVGGDFTDTTYHPSYGAAMSRYGYLQSVSSLYSWQQSITSINGGNPITAGQTVIPIVASGFTAKPTAVTATYAAGSKSISAAIGSGTSTSFNISVQDRIEAEDWPLNGDTITFTFTYGSESASGTQTLVKKVGETVLTFAGAITSDPATLTDWLTQDGFTAEGGELVYEQPPATGTMPTPDLVLTPSGGGSVKEACTFNTWFRPIADKDGYPGRAGNVYEYQWVITEAGISPVGSGGLTSVAITAVAITAVGLTSAGLAMGGSAADEPIPSGLFESTQLLDNTFLGG